MPGPTAEAWPGGVLPGARGEATIAVDQDGRRRGDAGLDYEQPLLGGPRCPTTKRSSSAHRPG